MSEEGDDLQNIKFKEKKKSTMILIPQSNKREKKLWIEKIDYY